SFSSSPTTSPSASTSPNSSAPKRARPWHPCRSPSRTKTFPSQPRCAAAAPIANIATSARIFFDGVLRKHLLNQGLCALDDFGLGAERTHESSSIFCASPCFAVLQELAEVMRWLG